MKRFGKLLIFSSMMFSSVGVFAQANEAVDANDVDPIEIYSRELYTVDFDSIVFNIGKNPRAYYNLKYSLLNLSDQQWSQMVCRYVPIRVRESQNVNDFWYSFPEVTEKNLRLGLPLERAKYVQQSPGASDIGYFYNMMDIILRLINENSIQVYKYNINRPEDFSKTSIIKRDDIFDILQKYVGANITVDPTTKQKEIKMEDYMPISSEVLGYELQEAWYYDSRLSEFRRDITAISPLVLDAEKQPVFLFTISMEQIAPYLMLLYNQSPNRYNDFSMSYQSYFNKTQYSGFVLRIPNAKGELLFNKCLVKSQPGADGAAPTITTSVEMLKCWQEESNKVDKFIGDFERKELWSIPTIFENRDEKAKLLEEKRKAEASKKSKSSKPSGATPSKK